MKTRRFLALLPLAAVALAAAGCGGGGGLGSSDVAKVGGDTITVAQFDQLMTEAKNGYQAQHQKFPAQTSPQYQQLKARAIQLLVQRAQYDQAAKQLGVSISQKQINDRLNLIVKTYYKGSQAKFMAAIKKEHTSKASVENQVRDMLLQQALYNKITANVTVSPQQVKALYQQQYKPSRTVRHILVKSRALAIRLDNHLLADHGKDFAKLAKKYSKDPSSAPQGGKLTIQKGQTVMQFDKMAFMLGKGTISRPVRTQYGWHIIQPLSKVKPPTPFKQVELPIKEQLLSQKKQQAMVNWQNGLSKKYPATYQKGWAPAATQLQTPTPPTPQPPPPTTTG